MKNLLVAIMVVVSMSSPVLAQDKRAKDSIIHTPEVSFFRTASEENPPVEKVVPPVKKETGPRYKTVVVTDTPGAQQILRRKPAEVWVAPKPAPKTQVKEQVAQYKREKPEVHARPIARTTPAPKNRCKPCEEEEHNRRHYYH